MGYVSEVNGNGVKIQRLSHMERGVNGKEGSMDDSFRKFGRDPN